MESFGNTPGEMKFSRNRLTKPWAGSRKLDPARTRGSRRWNGLVVDVAELVEGAQASGCWTLCSAHQRTMEPRAAFAAVARCLRRPCASIVPNKQVTMRGAAYPPP